MGGNPLSFVDPKGLAGVLPGPIPLPLPGPIIPGQGKPRDDGSFGGLFPPGSVSSGSGSSSSSSGSDEQSCPAAPPKDPCKERKNYCITFCQYELDFPGRLGFDNTKEFLKCVRRCMEQTGCS